MLQLLSVVALVIVVGIMIRLRIKAEKWPNAKLLADSVSDCMPVERAV